MVWQYYFLRYFCLFSLEVEPCSFNFFIHLHHIVEKWVHKPMKTLIVLLPIFTFLGNLRDFLFQFLEARSARFDFVFHFIHGTVNTLNLVLKIWNFHWLVLEVIFDSTKKLTHMSIVNGKERLCVLYKQHINQYQQHLWSQINEYRGLQWRNRRINDRVKSVEFSEI